MTSAGAGRAHCTCTEPKHATRRVVVTGGPGGGKTATLELAKHRFCRHVVVLPESATLLFAGGFPRSDDGDVCRAAQRAIFHVQRELEVAAAGDDHIALTVCDRGTLDGLAYWPGDQASFFREVGTTIDAELARYDAVVHLRTPPADEYTHENRVRTETAQRAQLLDERIAEIWAQHPRRVFVDSGRDFIDKMMRALDAIATTVPSCCRS